jgi:hypothetical protein
VIDQKILALKIKVAEDRLAYLRSLLPVQRDPIDRGFERPLSPEQIVKRGPGRPKKAA